MMTKNNLTQGALELFSAIAERCGLQYSHEFPPQIELKFVIPRQAALDFELILTFQETDELHIYVDRMNFVFFPFPQPQVIECFA